MNATVRAVVRAALRHEMSVVGFKRGYNGVLMKSSQQTDDFTMLTGRSVSDKIHRGGTFLMTARCLEFKELACQKKAIDNLNLLGVEGLVCIGGDGTFHGGNGGLFWKGSWGTGSTDTPDGAGGQGGWDNGVSASRTSPVTVGGEKHGGYRGSGGAKGANGGNGTLYRDSGVTLNATYASATSATTHSAIEYSLAFSDGQRVNESKTARLGYALPTPPAEGERPGWRFEGWFTEKNGAGTKYYDANGAAALDLDEYAFLGDLTLYGHWTLTDPSLAGTISINGVGLSGGVSQTGDGWTYDGSTGYVRLFTEGKRYVVTGKDEAGEFSLLAHVSCEIVISNLTLNTSGVVDRPPFEVREGQSPTLLLEGENTLRSCEDMPAVCIGRYATLTIGECGGRLTAYGGLNCAGIGSAAGVSSPNLNIRGGVIDAKGGNGGAGIGGAAGSGFGKIAISGGTVTATGGRNGAGIGSGESGTGFAVEISGGSVTAYGGSSNSAAGIGGGYRATHGSVKISGGTVGALGGPYAAGIGAGDAAVSGTATSITVEISGGVVTASSTSAAAIGPGDYTSCGAISISGGTVFARTGSSVAKSIGRSHYGEASSLTVTGGSVLAANGMPTAPAPLDASGAQVHCVTVSGLPANTRIASLAPWSSGDGFSSFPATYGANDLCTDDEGKLYLWLPDGSYDFLVTPEGGEAVERVASVSGADADAHEFDPLGYRVDGVDIGHYAGDGWRFEASACSVRLTDSRDYLLSGAAAQTGRLSRIGFDLLQGGGVVASNLVVDLVYGDGEEPGRTGPPLSLGSGATATLTLAGTNSLRATADAAAVRVAAGQSLTIDGDGSLAATGGEHGAGIGGSYREEGGTIVIAGGTITATGGGLSAGIGGSLRAGGDIAIRGGTVTAQGGENGAGIGGGYDAAGTITISGGTILGARGGNGGAGIGAAANYVDGTIRITGGVIEIAQGGGGAAGIGGGSGRVDKTLGSIEISGGIVRRAEGGSGAAGIGGGANGAKAAISISGGTVGAVAGSGASCAVGRPGNSYSDGTVVVSGGSLRADASAVYPAAKDTFDYAVFPVDFGIGVATCRVDSLVLELRGNFGGNLASAFSTYGANDLYTDEYGNLRLWLPSTDGAPFAATVAMEDGSVHYFVFGIEDDGTVAQLSHIVVNGEIVTDFQDASGTGWSYQKATSLVTLSADATVQGVSTNGSHRLFVPRGGASKVTLQGLDLRAGADKYASAFVVSNDCDLVLDGGTTNALAATGQYAAGIEVVSDVTLTIRAEEPAGERGEYPTLAAFGGKYGAGIGTRGGNRICGKIRIESGNVVARGGYRAAGIGGGDASNLQTDGIEISGGYVDARGGESGAGIGGGKASVELPDGAVKVTGGTVLAAHGGNIGLGGDLIKGSDNTVPVTGSAKPFVVTGGSVHGANLSVQPNPVDAAGAPLRYWLFTGIEPGTAFADKIVDGLPENYGTNDLVADATGSVCLWLPMTNGVRTLRNQDFEFVGGGTTNNVFTFADRAVGVTVNGLDLAYLSGEGWTFSKDARILSLSGAGPFAISGAATNVSIRADADCAVTLRDLSISNVVGALAPFDCGSCTVAMTLSGANRLVSSCTNAPGIHAAAGATLTIDDVQPSDAEPSVLVAEGGYNAAGIGGSDFENGGSIEISGGTVTATGGQFGAGVGGGHGGSGGTIAITDGDVTATGGAYGAGIGGGYGIGYANHPNADGGDITISGGVVKATGSAGAGIGGGFHGPGGRIAISGGDVTAVGRSGGAGIGGGYSAAGGDIAISGGDVTATGGDYGAGIGGGNEGSGGSITISGGVVKANGGHDGAGIGGGDTGAAGAIEIAGGQVTATGRSGGAAIGGGWKGQGGSVAIRGGTVAVTQDYNFNAPTIGYGTGGSVDSVAFTGGAIYTTAARVSPAATNDVAGAAAWPVDFDLGVPGAKVESIVIDTPPLAYGAKDLYADANGVLRLWLPDGNWFLDLKPEGGDTERWVAAVDGENALAARYAPGSVGFFVNGTDVGEVVGEGWAFDTVRGGLTLSGDGPFELSGTLTNATVAIAANCAVTLSNAVVDASAVTNAGAIHLASGVTATLSLVGENAATGGVGRAGVTVPGGATLTITDGGASSPSEPRGSLSATGGACAAGIGGDDSAQTGTIRIQGGAITATGGASGAGIGGGSYAGEQSCRIEISGGFVTATAGEGAYAIGAGVRNGAFSSDFGHVAISGGTVRPVHSSALGIGSGADKATSNFNSFRISGGAIFTDRSAVSPVAWSVGVQSLAYPVDFDLGEPDAPVNASIPLASGDSAVEYGLQDVRTDARGVARLWLPEGNRLVTVDGVLWRVSVSPNGSSAGPWHANLTVNGAGIESLSGEGWNLDVATMVVHLTGAGPFELSGEEEGTAVSVETSCAVVLKDVTLATGETGPAALDFRDDVTATLELVGTNSLASGKDHPGLGIAETASLAIRGEGGLSAFGGYNGAGIGGGGGSAGHCGALSIEGGVIVAQGGWSGAGIGGASGSSCGTIAISGGDVTALGGLNAPGIGQKENLQARPGSILVSGGVVTATGGEHGAGIGGGLSPYYYHATPVVISGGVVAATGGEGGAGIGGSAFAMADVTISGGVVTATGGYHGAGIGGGEGSYGVTYSAGTVRISGGIVSATAGEGAHGIGGGYLSDRGSVEITGGTVAAAGG
ncbi:MAG: 6-phosphofructokinase, partial [Kiritimatiellae bacterium]|nr:6-phosphofructokinase [Kiritimatiellia bacterium]